MESDVLVVAWYGWTSTKQVNRAGMRDWWYYDLWIPITNLTQLTLRLTEYAVASVELVKEHPVETNARFVQYVASLSQ